MTYSTLVLAATAPLWRTIDQPPALKLLVASIGLAFIVGELWWFLAPHGSGVEARQGSDGRQEVTITVDGGYDPPRIRVVAGQPLRLTFHRIDPSSCVAQDIFPDFQRSLDLPLDASTSIDLLPVKPGLYPFHCGMNMVRGMVEVVAG